jgi:hypothetical protein
MIQESRTGARPTLKVLTGVAVALCAWAWWVVLNDPVYRHSLPHLFGNSTPSQASPLPDAGIYEAKDPPLGSELPRNETGVEIRAKASSKNRGYLVAALGDCGSCTRLDLTKLYQQCRPRQISLMGFAHGDASKAKKLATELARDGVDVPIFFDKDSKLTGALNAYYAGRLYFFTADWKLRWRELDWNIDNYLFSTGRFDRIVGNTQP